MTSREPAPRQLLILHGGRYQRHALPPSGAVFVGRGDSCEVRIDDPSVARRHALIRVNGCVMVEDLGGGAVTRVRGARIEPGTAVHVQHGQPIGIGEVTLVVVGDPGATASASAVAVPAAVEDQPSTGSVVCDPRMVEIRKELGQFALGDLGILLLGETGVGKEILAELVHRMSRRTGGPFLRVNCAAISESLADSELFGHERSSFTGADATRPGLLESAHGGSVFLDEIGELSAALQAKLLRVLDERKVLRVGAREPIPIDVRFIAATNRDLPDDVARGRFRRDLYYRLAGLVVTIPPLRQRQREIGPLAARFAASASERLGHARPPELSPAALERLRTYEWPGNVRQLATVIERAVTRCSTIVDAQHLELDPIPPAPAAQPPPQPPTLDDEQRIIAALEFTAGNQSEAARLLGISRRTLLKRLDQYDLPRPRKHRRRNA